MTFYDSLDNVEKYVKMCAGYIPDELIKILKSHLKPNLTLLEIGMGPGFDLTALAETYRVTGSDFSEHFIDIYQKKYPEADLLQLDAVTLNTSKQFDCLYSNKVLMHLSSEDLEKSAKRQSNILKKDGLIFHTFWKGTGEEVMKDLFTQYYLEESLLDIFSPYFNLIDIQSYKEFEEDDSILLIMKLK